MKQAKRPPECNCCGLASACGGAKPRRSGMIYTIIIPCALLIAVSAMLPLFGVGTRATAAAGLSTIGAYYVLYIILRLCHKKPRCP